MGYVKDLCFEWIENHYETLEDEFIKARIDDFTAMCVKVHAMRSRFLLEYADEFDEFSWRRAEVGVSEDVSIRISEVD